MGFSIELPAVFELSHSFFLCATCSVISIQLSWFLSDVQGFLCCLLCDCVVGALAYASKEVDARFRIAQNTRSFNKLLAQLVISCSDACCVTKVGQLHSKAISIHGNWNDWVGSVPEYAVKDATFFALARSPKELAKVFEAERQLTQDGVPYVKLERLALKKDAAITHVDVLAMRIALKDALEVLEFKDVDVDVATEYIIIWTIMGTTKGINQDEHKDTESEHNVTEISPTDAQLATSTEEGPTSKELQHEAQHTSKTYCILDLRLLDAVELPLMLCDNPPSEDGGPEGKWNRHVWGNRSAMAKMRKPSSDAWVEGGWEDFENTSVAVRSKMTELYERVQVGRDIAFDVRTLYPGGVPLYLFSVQMPLTVSPLDLPPAPNGSLHNDRGDRCLNVTAFIPGIQKYGAEPVKEPRVGRSPNEEPPELCAEVTDILETLNGVAVAVFRTGEQKDNRRVWASHRFVSLRGQSFEEWLRGDGSSEWEKGAEGIAVEMLVTKSENVIFHSCVSHDAKGAWMPSQVLVILSQVSWRQQSRKLDHEIVLVPAILRIEIPLVGEFCLSPASELRLSAHAWEHAANGLFIYDELKGDLLLRNAAAARLATHIGTAYQRDPSSSFGATLNNFFTSHEAFIRMQTATRASMGQAWHENLIVGSRSVEVTVARTLSPISAGEYVYVVSVLDVTEARAFQTQAEVMLNILKRTFFDASLLIKAKCVNAKIEFHVSETNAKADDLFERHLLGMDISSLTANLEECRRLQRYFASLSLSSHFHTEELSRTTSAKVNICFARGDVPWEAEVFGIILPRVESTLRPDLTLSLGIKCMKSDEKSSLSTAHESTVSRPPSGRYPNSRIPEASSSSFGDSYGRIPKASSDVGSYGGSDGQHDVSTVFPEDSVSNLGRRDVLDRFSF